MWVWVCVCGCVCARALMCREGGRGQCHSEPLAELASSSTLSFLVAPPTPTPRGSGGGLPPPGGRRGTLQALSRSP